MNELTAFDELENRIRHFVDEFHRLKTHVSETGPDKHAQEKIEKVEEKVKALLQLIDQLEMELTHE